MLIPAIGQALHGSLFERSRGPKYYSGGDCVNGGREVVDAVAEGKRAALAIAASFEVAHAR
jgi:glutamate synthase (NADPH/NADH) small chain